MNSQLVTALFKNKKYYKQKNSFGEFALDSNIMRDINIPRIIDKEIAIKELSIIKKVFDNFEINFFLTHGTCLGAIRDNNFIQHDSDIDLGALKKDLDKIISAVEILREEHHFKVTKLSLNDESIALIKENVIIDISLYQTNGKKWQSNKSKIFSIPQKHLDSFSQISFIMLNLNVPNKVEEYLIFQYGKDWKTPIEDFYCPYKRKIEAPISGILKYVVGKQKALSIAKRISTFVKKYN